MYFEFSKMKRKLDHEIWGGSVKMHALFHFRHNSDVFFWVESAADYFITYFVFLLQVRSQSWEYETLDAFVRI